MTDEILKAQINSLPSGYVLHKPSPRERVRIITPRRNNNCDVCGKKTDQGEKIISTNNMSKTTLTECIDCYLERWENIIDG